MPPASKTCKVQVWRDNVKAPCGVEYKGDRCPERADHIMSLKTGHCASGWCEGTKAKDWRGNPVRTCHFFWTCPCECHAVLYRIAELTETERMLQENPEYVHPKREFWMPSDDPADWLPRPHENGETPVLIESPAPEIVPATVQQPFAPTATGRAARGELEAWVKEQCDIWLIEEYKINCTPVWLAEQIGIDKGITAPSVGAIGAVFERWTKLGFAVIEKKPTRFVRYSDEGIRLGLDRMKERAKRRAKLTEAQRRRNSVR